MRCSWIVCTGPSRSAKLSQPSSMKFSVTPSRVVDWRRRVYVFHSVLITAHPTWPDPAQVIKGVILQPIISDVRQQASSSIKPSSNRGLLELASWEKKKVLPLNKHRKMQLAIVMTGEICEKNTVRCFLTADPKNIHNHSDDYGKHKRNCVGSAVTHSELPHFLQLNGVLSGWLLPCLDYILSM